MNGKTTPPNPATKKDAQKTNPQFCKNQHDYQVQAEYDDKTQTYLLSGYAYAPNAGWICFGDPADSNYPIIKIQNNKLTGTISYFTDYVIQ
ncbi:MAG: hypothetical protein HZA01_08930 [Nitrospinae bacterium]|nr:hypothetical protein [Nitrospinota bacterium]